eukprot:scpid58239/ scgid28658/ PiggyBac transposable element-derived protein 4
MAAPSVPIEDALAFVLDEDASDVSLSDSELSDVGMSSGEEEQINLALLGKPESDVESEPEEEEAEEIADSSSDRERDNPSPDAGEESADDREREPLEPTQTAGAARGRRGGAARGPRAGRGGRGVGRSRGGGGVPPAPVAAPADLKSWEDDDARPQLPVFNPIREPGCHFPDGFHPENEVDFFRLFFTHAVVGSFVGLTNSSADAHIGTRQSYATSEGCWSKTNVGEMYRFIRLVIYMGLVGLPHVQHYWSTKTLLHGTWARAMISTRTRFQATTILSFLKVVDHTTENLQDKLRKVRFLCKHICTTSCDLYQPSIQLAIDERMVKSKARFGYMEYITIRNKPVKFGIKVFALCDSNSSYLCNFKIYTGRAEAGQADVGLAHRTVVELLEPYWHQGYHVFTDNFYSSPELYNNLSDNYNTRACGTCQVNRRGISRSFKNSKEFQRRANRSDMRYVREGSLIQLQWMDKRCVTMISNIHSATEFVNENRTIKQHGQLHNIVVKKPETIQVYNMAMGGVDKFDQLVASYRILRKTKKYWKTLFLIL